MAVLLRRLLSRGMVVDGKQSPFLDIMIRYCVAFLHCSRFFLLDLELRLLARDFSLDKMNSLLISPAAPETGYVDIPHVSFDVH